MAETESHDLDFEQFKKNVYQKTNIDLNNYKEAQMKRRLASLRDKRGFTSFALFFQALTSDMDLFNEFLDRLTINVSEFYRNPERWIVLEKKILPDLIKQGQPLKVWSAASSTGEEPYSLVMLLSRFFDLSRIQVLATDLDQNVILKAKKGIYVHRSVEALPQDMLDRYFTKQEITYTIHDEVKKRVTYQKQNLLKDSYPSGFDLIVCRNVLIYFTDHAKKQIYSKFAQALKPGGVLFVGSTEQIFHPEEFGMQAVDAFFYRKL